MRPPKGHWSCVSMPAGVAVRHRHHALTRAQALSEAQAYIFEERDRLQAALQENEGLRRQELQDQRRIEQLLALADRVRYTSKPIGALLVFAVLSATVRLKAAHHQTYFLTEGRRVLAWRRPLIAWF